MERERRQIEKAVEDEFSGTHSVFIGEDPKGLVLSIVIKDEHENIVTRGFPMFTWGDVNKWSDDGLRSTIRSLVFGRS